MKDNVLIKVEGVSKKFCRNLGSSIKYGLGDVTRDLVGLDSKPATLRGQEFWAVDNASFELKRGESLGIIGPNGSGKTTLLKMLNGIFMPDKGRIEVKGKVGALIEVGAGFHPMLTGRENIYVNGAILGMGKKETDRKFDSIVSFAEVGDFLNSPVKFYSAGMRVRLGFAIAIHCEPDILLIDEVLAVGDREFQIKCFQKVYELVKNGVCLILVSHNVYAMREYTKRCLFLKYGEPLFLGNSEDAITLYINDSLSDRANKMAPSLEAPKIKESGNKINAVHYRNSKMEKINKITAGDTLIVDIEYQLEREIKNPIFGVSFYKGGRLICGFINSYENILLPPIKGKGVARLSIERILLLTDAYECSVILCEDSIANTLIWQNVPEFLLIERAKDTRGLIKLEQRWQIVQKT